ncbi:MAG: tetratricopeptide repeat protein [Anaerolineales bacterium]
MVEVLNATQLAKEAKQAYQREDYESAARTFLAAAKSYTTSQDPLNAAEMANNASVAYLQAGDSQAALEAVEGTAEIFAAKGDVRRQAMALGNQGAALEAIKRYKEAEAAYQQSADLLKQVGEDQLRLNVMQSLSRLQARTGRQLEALASMQAGLDDVNRPSPRQRILKKLLEVPFKFMK